MTRLWRNRMSDFYKKKKEEFDSEVLGYLVKRLREPFGAKDGFGMKITDDSGNLVGQVTPENHWAFTGLDRLVALLKTKLGPDLERLPEKYDAVDSLTLMYGMDVDKNMPVYKKVVGLVEEISYLPNDNRGAGAFQEDSGEEGMTLDLRIQRAFTCAQFLMACIINNGTVAREGVMDFDQDVLETVEETFNIRSVGTYAEIVDYLKKGHVIDYANVKPEGYLLAVRIAKALMEAEGTIFNKERSLPHNDAADWRTLSSYGG